MGATTLPVARLCVSVVVWTVRGVGQGWSVVYVTIRRFRWMGWCRRVWMAFA